MTEGVGHCPKVGLHASIPENCSFYLSIYLILSYLILSIYLSIYLPIYLSIYCGKNHGFLSIKIPRSNPMSNGPGLQILPGYPSPRPFCWSNSKQRTLTPRTLCMGETELGTRPGERLHSNGKSPFLMGKLTISMAIFHCYVSSPEGKPTSLAGAELVGNFFWRFSAVG